MTRTTTCGCTGCAGITKAEDVSPLWGFDDAPWRLMAIRHRIDLAVAHTGAIPAPWMDHTYRIKLGNEQVTYVAEPYSIGHDALSDLAFLHDRGDWDVLISAEAARHCPGKTVAIHLTRRPIESRGAHIGHRVSRGIFGDPTYCLACDVRLSGLASR